MEGSRERLQEDTRKSEEGRYQINRVAERRNYGPETLGKVATFSEKQNTSIIIDDMGEERFNLAIEQDI